MLRGLGHGTVGRRGEGGRGGGRGGGGGGGGQASEASAMGSRENMGRLGFPKLRISRTAHFPEFHPKPNPEACMNGR